MQGGGGGAERGKWRPHRYHRVYEWARELRSYPHYYVCSEIVNFICDTPRTPY